MWSNLRHLQLMLSWPALYISNPYSTGLIIKKARNCLVTATAHSTHPSPCLSTSWGFCPCSSIPHTLVPTHFRRLSPCPNPSHQYHSPHSMPICSTSSNCHQPTYTSPCILPAPTSPMPCTAYHHHNSPALPCTQATKSTHKATTNQATNVMHHLIGSTPLAAAQHKNSSLPPMTFLCHGLGELCGARCLHMLPLIMLIILNPTRRPGLSPSKSS